MASNYKITDPFQIGLLPDETPSSIDLDDYLITESELLDQWVGNNLFGWGANSFGQLGQGDRTHRSSPTQVGS